MGQVLMFLNTGSSDTSFGTERMRMSPTGNVNISNTLICARAGIGVASVMTGYLFDVGRGTGDTTAQTNIRYFQASATGLWRALPNGSIWWGGINSARVDGDIWCLSALI